MTERPARQVFGRPPDDDVELDAWAESFAHSLLGGSQPLDNEPNDCFMPVQCSSTDRRRIP